MASVHCEVKVTASAEAKVRRGPQSWAYFYMVGGVILAVVLTAISVLDIPGWVRAIYIVCVAAIIIVAIADSNRLHELLLRVKRAYEDKFR